MIKKRAWLVLAVLIVAVGMLIGFFFYLQTMHSISSTAFVMNTVVEYKLYGKNAGKAQQEIHAALIDIENKMSMYIESSEIAQLNHHAGIEKVPLSQNTFDLLTRCVDFGAQSNGVFDVTIAPLTEEWGITEMAPEVPKAETIDSLRDLVHYNDIQLDSADNSAMLKGNGQAVDVGGIAKGFACGVAREIALKNGITSGYISIGGNLMVVGNKPGGEPFRFGVRDPRGEASDYIGVITLPDSTMATSGDYERFFEQNGKIYHHILDPRTGYPAESDLMSVSVISPDGAYADFLSTYLFIMGKEFALERLNASDYALIVVDADKNVYTSPSIRDNFTPANAAQAYRFIM